MAKNTRGGLGRGLSSLINTGSDNSIPQERTSNREQVEYDEDLDYTNLQPKSTTSYNVSRETSFSSRNTGEIPVVSKIPSLSSNSPVIDKTSSISISSEKNNKKDITELSIDEIEANPNQPRTDFRDEDLDELARSIKRDGLIQPIIVRAIEDDKYQIIAGERRWQASKRAGLDKVPVRVKEIDDDKAIEIALIENIQRVDLNPIEEAYAYKRLMDKNKMTQADIAQAVSKGRSTIANSLRLLDLPEKAQQMLYEDKITAGHARAILSVPTKEGRESITNKLEDQQLSVRETESLARLLANKPEKGSVKRESVPQIYKSIARSLKDILKTNVKIKSSNGKNKIEIEFKDEEQLRDIFDEIVSE